MSSMVKLNQSNQAAQLAGAVKLPRPVHEEYGLTRSRTQNRKKSPISLISGAQNGNPTQILNAELNFSPMS